MNNAVVIRGQIRIPEWVKDLDSFHRWTASPDYPDSGWFSYFRGEIWVDTSMEEMNHNQLKGEFAIVVGSLVRADRLLGRYFHDRMRLSNAQVDLSTEPDGMFVSRATLKEGRVQLIEGSGDSPVRVEGTPDMVLEVVSEGSVKKDTDVLRELYARAGIPEYWLVDPSEEPASFEILKLGPRGYVPVRGQRGWLKPGVFGKSFQLTQEDAEDGHPGYRLALR
jgi:Uma2 family endonuclease